MFGKDAKKKELIKNLGQIYDQIQREYQISPGDFPDIKKMQVRLLVERNQKAIEILIASCYL